jgi:hypothetical protein
LYVAISLAVMFLAVVLGLSPISLEAGGKVLSFVLFTGILYGSFIAYNRSLFRSWAFWRLTITLLSAHLAVFIAINMYVDHWRPIWNGIMFLEIPILDFLKGRLVHVHRNHKPS